MSLSRSGVCALALFGVVPMLGGAAAETLPPHSSVRIQAVAHFIDDWQGETGRVIVVVGDDSVTNAVEATIESDAGEEDVTLVESNAWLHGAATLKALPKADATLTLTLYDKGSASLISLTGTLSPAGVVTFAAAGGKGATTECASKSGCTSDASATTVDVEVLAGEVFAASGGYELTLDLAGADTYTVAYGMLVVTEGKTATKAEVGWDAIGAVWDADLTLDHEGVVEAKVKTYDAAGEKLDTTKAKLGAPWIDAGQGVNTLATDEDPLTVVGLTKGLVGSWSFDDSLAQDSSRYLSVVSEGWTSTTVPVAAQVELTDGSTITVPASSYQRRRRESDFYNGPDFPAVQVPVLLREGATVSITGGSVAVADVSLSALTDSPICAKGACFMLVEDGDDADRYVLSVSEYGTDAGKLADELDLTVAVYDASGEKVASESGTIEFEDDVSAVFVNEVSFTEDPVGTDLSGKVSLLGAADKKGKQKTLAKGKFYSSVSRDGDGDLDLVGADKDVVVPNGSILKPGSAVPVELTDTDKDGVVNGPLLVPMLKPGGKKGTGATSWNLEMNKKV